MLMGSRTSGLPMSPPGGPSDPAISAPGLTGPTSILNWPVARTPSRKRRSQAAVYESAHIELELKHPKIRSSGTPVVRQIERALSERKVVESPDLLDLAAQTLHAFAAKGYTELEGWNVHPGSPPPLPPSATGKDANTVGHLLDALRGDEWKALAKSRSFEAKVGDRAGNHAAIVVRRIHRERRASISADLEGSFTEADIRKILDAVRDRLPVARSTVEKVRARVR
jgi:hypothetical protein